MFFNFKKKVIDWYERDGCYFVIAVSTNSFRDLFNKFDRTSSFIKRELDYEFADYLYESALELEKRQFYIRIDLLSEKKAAELELKVNKGIDNYFEYERHKVQKHISQMMKKIVLHLLMAIVCLFVSYSLNRYVTLDSFFYTLFIESLVIASWVFMWPLFSEFLYEFLDDLNTIKVYTSLIDAEIVFNYIE